MNERSKTSRVLSGRLPLGPLRGARPSLRPFEEGATATRLVDFYGREFLITPKVLIPRPETEMMVDAVLNLAGKAFLPGVKASKSRLDAEFSVLDVGTGSGCIAITLALELPEAKVFACDISKGALEVARKNASRLGAKVEFSQSDLMEEVAGDFEVVVANLPYVDEAWEWLDKEALAHEPEGALYAGDGGLELIQKLISQVAERGVRFLVLEADPCQHERVVEFASGYGYSLLEERGFAMVFERSS